MVAQRRWLGSMSGHQYDDFIASRGCFLLGHQPVSVMLDLMRPAGAGGRR